MSQPTLKQEASPNNATNSPAMNLPRLLLIRLQNFTNQSLGPREEIDELQSFTLAHTERINFTLHCKPINYSCILTNYSNVVGTVIHGVFDFGESVVKGAADLGKTTINEGANLVTNTVDKAVGIFSGRLKTAVVIVMCVIAGFIGLFLLLRIIPNVRKDELYMPKQAMNIAQRLQKDNSMFLTGNNAPQA